MAPRLLFIDRVRPSPQLQEHPTSEKLPPLLSSGQREAGEGVSTASRYTEGALVNIFFAHSPGEGVFNLPSLLDKPDLLL